MAAPEPYQSRATGSDIGQSRRSRRLGDSRMRRASLAASTSTKALRKRLWRMSIRPPSPSARASAWPAPQASAIRTTSKSAETSRPRMRWRKPVPGAAIAIRRRGPRVARRSRTKAERVATTMTPTLSATSAIRVQSRARRSSRWPRQSATPATRPTASAERRSATARVRSATVRAMEPSRPPPRRRASEDAAPRRATARPAPHAPPDPPASRRAGAWSRRRRERVRLRRPGRRREWPGPGPEGRRGRDRAAAEGARGVAPSWRPPDMGSLG